MRYIAVVLQRHALGFAALCIALSGTAYAASQLRANSVGSLQIRNGSVSSADVRNGSLRLEDFDRRRLPAGTTGPAGAAGPVGAAGPNGDRGPAGPSTGPAGGDLAGSYPDPTLAPLEPVVRVEASSGVNNCLTATSQFCGGNSTTGSGTKFKQWTNRGNGFETAGFWKDHSGVVHLQGSVRTLETTEANFDVAQPIFVLPAGYRPGATREWRIREAFRNPPGEFDVYDDTLDISADGRVMLGRSRATVGALPLDGIFFRP